MLHRPAPNEIIKVAPTGGNLPTKLFDYARVAINAVAAFLKENPIIAGADTAREANKVRATAEACLKDLEDERQALVRPLNQRVKEINDAYHVFHNTDAKRPGSADKIVCDLKRRLTAYAKQEEEHRKAVARAALAEAERRCGLARKAEIDEREAAEDAAQGVIGIDVARFTETADQAFADFKQADRAANLAVKDAHVRIGGGIGRVASLRNHEILIVTDWRAAIEDIGLTDHIRDAILTSARAYRKANGELPAGVEAEMERSI